MHNVQSRRDEPRGGAFEWVVPFVFVVFVLALSWTGMFVVVSDLVEAASKISVTDTVHE